MVVVAMAAPIVTRTQEPPSAPVPGPPATRQDNVRERSMASS